MSFNYFSRSNGVNTLGTRSTGNGTRILTNCNMVRPSWESKMPSIFRILPGLNPDTQYKTLDIFRMEDNNFGEWVRVVPSVSFAFTPDNPKQASSFALQRRPDDEDWLSCPYCVLYDAISRYAKQDDCPKYWSKLVSDNSKTLTLPRYKKVVIMPVLTYYRDDKCIPTDNLTAVDVLVVSEPLFLELRKFLVSNWATSEPGQAVDMTDPSRGNFFAIWNKAIGTPAGINPATVLTLQGPYGYSASVLSSFPVLGTQYDGASPALTKLQLDIYRSMAQPTWQYVNYISWEQQAEIICKQAPAGAVMYAFADEHPEWLVGNIRQRANSEPRIGSPIMPTAVAPVSWATPAAPTCPQPQYSAPYPQTRTSAYPAMPREPAAPQMPSRTTAEFQAPRTSSIVEGIIPDPQVMRRQSMAAMDSPDSSDDYSPV